MTPTTKASVTSLRTLIEQHASARPEATALCAPDRDPLTCRALADRVAHVGRKLNNLGIGRGHRVAIVLPNGPDLAVAFLAVATYAAAAPLNPAYREPEFEFFLADMKADALLVAGGSDSPATAVARRLGIRVVTLEPDRTAAAGTFQLTGDAVRLSADRTGPADADATALLLHTSGTTARPKLVPLTHANLCVAADNTRRAFAIGDSDLCLNMMPLHHAHGLTSTLLASLIGGGGIICTPGFSDTGFFAWLEAYRPTWYTAVPAMHQALLTVAHRHTEVIASHRLRFIRSASAPMPGPALAKLEQTFRAPVIEAYGMTEAGSLITSNPLPPRVRKPGSVGLPVGQPVAILDETGRRLAAGESGEIAIRGANVMTGYDNDPHANQRSFTDGWFRTGDEGRLDEDGYLHIVGRTREMINRGGSKVSPAQIDEVLGEHPAVDTAVAFGLPHPTLGEDVAVAIVPRPGGSVDERELRAFAAERLADFKVPSRVFVVSDVPRTPAGKVRRLKLAEQFATSMTSGVPRLPEEPMRRRLAEIWSRVLEREQVGLDDNFFDLGGNSLLLTRVCELLRDELAVDVPVPVLTMYPTVGSLAEYLSGGTVPAGTEQDTDRFVMARQRLLRQRGHHPRAEA
ncbi:AMP-binding protein [Actinophytocola sediminis]